MRSEAIKQAGEEPREEQPGSAEQGLTLDIVVEQPGNICNLYRQDRERGALRLERVATVEMPAPADLARFPLEAPRSALDMIGESTRHAANMQVPSLPVLLLSRAAVAPDTWVSVRLVGAVRAGASGAATEDPIARGWHLLAIPLADASQQKFQTAAHLPPARRAALAAFVASPEEPTDAPVEWLEADDAARLVRQARATWRQTQRQHTGLVGKAEGPREHLRLGRRQVDEEEQRVAWRALAGVSIKQLREQGLGAYAEAEHLIRLVPQRFQQYLGELLLDDERVLCFIERPRLRVTKGVFGLGARYLNEGLLLCTDRQVLWLRDVAAPDSTLVPWGYAARSCPVERLAGAWVVPAGQASEEMKLAAAAWPRLVVRSAAAQGVAALVLEFPHSALLALQQAAALLQGFLPQPSGSLQAAADRRVRRMPEVAAWQPRAEEQALLLQLGGMIPADARERLQAALRAALHPGEEVLAQTTAPALAEYQGGPRLLALTRERLLFGQTGERGRRGNAPQTTMIELPLARVAAVQMRHSLLGCTFAALVPEPDGRVTQPFIPFNSPAIVPFRAIYTRTRLLLAAPTGAAPAGDGRNSF